MINLSDFKQFVNPKLKEIADWFINNEKDILSVTGIVLIALISFGAGRLSVPVIVKQPVVVQNNDFFASAPSSSANLSQIIVNKRTTTINGQEGKLVASKNGKYYHWPWSSWAKNIKLENRVWFSSEAEAQVAGFKRASNFLETAPADYAP